MRSFAVLKVRALATWLGKAQVFWNNLGAVEGIVLFGAIAISTFCAAILVGYVVFLIWPVAVLAFVVFGLWYGFRRSPRVMLAVIVLLALSWYFYHTWAWDGVLSILLGITGIVLWAWWPYYHKPTPPLDPTSFSQGM